ncbi:MAG: M3 family oligoendopeptidase [Treponema sp.]|nr:M3 family oligoendopeptidase [Treponema sp.]
MDSDEYKKALKDYSSYMEELEQHLKIAEEQTNKKDIDFPSWLDKYLTLFIKFNDLETTLGAYAYIIYSTDTTNTDYLNNMSTIDEMGLRSGQISIRFNSILSKNKESLKNFYKIFPKYCDYEYILGRVIEDTEHQMSAAEENLASDLQRTGGNAWSRLHEQLISNMHDENGKTFNELRNDAYSADAKLRKSSWKKEVNLLQQNEIAFAASLNNLKGETVTLNKRRNWNEAIDRAIFSSKLNKETLNALICAIEESLPIWRDYLQTKAMILRKYNSTESKTSGIENHKGIAFYDLFAPLCNDCSYDKNSLLSKDYTFEEAKEYILKEYYSFSKDMGDFAKQAFEKNWIDAKVHAGKVGGAYDQDFAKGHQSRILSNFTGAFSDIVTLAHELGHAYHFSCMKDKESIFYNYPMTLAETASTFAETIVKQDAIKSSVGSDKINLIELDLQDTCQVLVDILCRFYFEQSVFEQRQKGELCSEDFCRLMREAQEKSYGNGLNDEESSDGKFLERHEYMWAVKSHYYSTDLDFYNFPYAFGQLFAAALYEKAKKEGPSFAKTYADLLSETGSMSCEDLCKKAGFDITKKEFWLSGIKMYCDELRILKENA